MAGEQLSAAMKYEIVLLIDSAELSKLSVQASESGLQAMRLEHELDWLCSDTHGDGTTGAALAVYKNDVLVGYLPFLHRRQHRLQLRLGEIRLASIPFSILQMFGTLVVTKDENVAGAALAAMANVTLPHCAITVEETPADCVGWRACERLAPRLFIKTERGRAPHHIVRLPSSYADYLTQFSKKSRYNMARRTHLAANRTLSAEDVPLPIVGQGPDTVKSCPGGKFSTLC